MFILVLVADKSTGVPSNSGMRSVGRTILGPSANMEQVTSRNVTAGQAANLALQVILHFDIFDIFVFLFSNSFSDFA